MIELTRSLIKLCCDGFQRSVWSPKIGGNRNKAPVLIESGSFGLRIISQGEKVWLRYEESTPRSSESVALGAEDFSRFAGSVEERLGFSVVKDHVKVTWLDEIPPTKERVPLGDRNRMRSFPSISFDLHSAKPFFLAAVDRALHCVGKPRQGVRLPFTRLLVDRDGWVCGTDGRQLFWEEGFDFPWSVDLLLPPVPFLAWQSLQRYPLSYGFAEGHFCFRAGPFTLVLKDETDETSRLPEIATILRKREEDCVATLDVSEPDAARLLEKLPSFPGDEDGNRLVVLDLHPERCSVMAADADPRFGPGAYLQSAFDGEPLELKFNSSFLLWALKTGFRHFFFLGVNQSIYAENGNQQYVWMPYHTPAE